MDETQNSAARQRSTAGTILYILVGPILWAAHLATIYFVQSMLCARGVAVEAVPAIVLAATAVAVLLIVALLMAPRAASLSFRAGGWGEHIHATETRLMQGLALLSIAGIVWGGATVLIIPSCPTLR